MAKFIKRIGTKAFKFATEIHLEKVNMEVPVASRILITFKRGPHKVESKSFPSLENGIANFDETLLMNSTLYYDKKKNVYLSKEASLVIFTVSVKGSKVAGHVKFDLAELPNLNLKERKYVWSVMECVDSKATIQVTVRNLQTEELSGKHVDSDEEHKQAVQSHNHTLTPSKEQHKEQNNQILSRTPDSNGVLNESHSNSLNSTLLSASPKSLNFTFCALESESSSEKNQKDPKFIHSTPLKENHLHDPQKQAYSSDTQSDVRSLQKDPDEIQTSNTLILAKPFIDLIELPTSSGKNPREHLVHSEIKSGPIIHEKPVFESQIKKEIADSQPISRINEFELKNKAIEREKRDLIQKMQGLDFEVINSRVSALQKENAVLSKKKKDLENKLQHTDLKEYEIKIAEYERMIAILREERNALDKGDRPSVLEFEKLKRNLTETEFMISYLKNEKQQSEVMLTAKIEELQTENQRLKFDNEKLSKQLVEARTRFEDREKENGSLREEISKLREEISKLRAEALNFKSTSSSSRGNNIDVVKKALLDAQKTISNLSEEKEQSEKALKSIIEQLRKENSTYKAQTEGLNSINIETLKKNSKESETVLERLRRENESLQKKFEEQIMNLIKEKQELEVFLRDTQTEDTHQMSFDSMGFVPENYKKNEAFQEDIDKLRQKIRNLEIQNWNLSKEKEDAMRRSKDFEHQHLTLQHKVEELERQQRGMYGQKSVLNEVYGKEGERRAVQEKIELERKVQALTYERDELSKTIMVQLQNATREKEENLEQLKDLKRQLDERNKQLSKQGAELEKKIQELEIEKKRALKTESEKVKELNEKVKGFAERQREWKSKVGMLSEKEGELSHRIEELIEKINELNNEIEELNGQKQILGSQLEMQRSRNNEIEQQKTEAQRENQELQNEAEHLKLLIQSLESQIEKTKSEAQFSSERGTKIKESEEGSEGLKKENKSLKSKLESKTNQIEELKEEIDKLNQELKESVEKLKKENKNLKNKIETKNQEIDELNEEIEKLNQEFEGKLKKSGRKSQRPVKSAKENSSAEEEEEEEKSGSDEEGSVTSDLKHENSLLRMENETLKGLYEKAMKSSRSKGGSTTTDDKSDTSEKRAELLTKLQKAEEQVTNLDKELEQLRVQNSESAQVKAENETLKSKLEQAETQIAELTAKISSLESSVSNSEQEILSLREENTKLAQLRDQFETSKDRVEELSKEKQQLTQKIERLNKNLAEYESQEEEHGKRLRLIEGAKLKMESQYLKLQDDFNTVKGEWMEAEAQVLKLKTNIRIMEEGERNLNARLTKMAEDLITAKTDLGEVINTVFELGSGDVIDAIENRVLNKIAE